MRARVSWFKYRLAQPAANRLTHPPECEVGFDEIAGSRAGDQRARSLCTLEVSGAADQGIDAFPARPNDALRYERALTGDHRR